MKDDKLFITLGVVILGDELWYICVEMFATTYRHKRQFVTDNLYCPTNEARQYLWPALTSQCRPQGASKNCLSGLPWANRHIAYRIGGCSSLIFKDSWTSREISGQRLRKKIDVDLADSQQSAPRLPPASWGITTMAAEALEERHAINKGETLRIHGMRGKNDDPYPHPNSLDPFQESMHSAK